MPGNSIVAHNSSDFKRVFTGRASDIGGTAVNRLPLKTSWDAGLLGKLKRVKRRTKARGDRAKHRLTPKLGWFSLPLDLWKPEQKLGHFWGDKEHACNAKEICT